MTLDPRFGNFVNHDLADYLVPVHADIPDVDAIFLPELDNMSNPLKSKGVGELGICGAGASLANAIYNACGARIRDYPITLDKILSSIPMQTMTLSCDRLRTDVLRPMALSRRGDRQ